MMQENKILKQSGAYVLLIELDKEFSGSVGSLGEISLAAGHYFYFGSARGPGGLGSRLKRHVRPDKKIHWHVDHITLAGNVIGILPIAGANECELCKLARNSVKLSVPVPGFGSSDCQSCPAHFFAVRGSGMDVLEELATKTKEEIYSAESFLPTIAAQPSIV